MLQPPPSGTIRRVVLGLLEPDPVSVSWNVAKSGDADLAAAQLAAEVQGQRGFQIVRRGVARAFRVLVRGGTHPDRYAQAKEAGRLNEIPTNHSPHFAPVIHPTLHTRVETLVVAERAWLAP